MDNNGIISEMQLKQKSPPLHLTSFTGNSGDRENVAIISFTFTYSIY